MNTIISSHVPKSLQERICSFERSANWDDEDADAITRGDCQAAIQFIEDVLADNPEISLPRVSPSVYGYVTLHWRNQDNHLLIGVRSGSDAAFYQSEGPNNMRLRGNEARNQAIRRVLSLFAVPHAAQA